MAKQQENNIISAAEAAFSVEEMAGLERCETIIERGLGTFIEVGSALLEINERRLYRRSHESFDTYCRERWNMTRTHAYQLIDAARINENLSTIVDKPDSQLPTPQSEGQTRPMRNLPPKKQRRAWKKAVTASPNGRPTAKDVAEAVKAVEAEPEEEDEPEAPTETAAERKVREWLESIPLRAKLTDRCRAVFDDDALAAREAANHIAALRRILGAHEENRPPGQKAGAWLAQVGVIARLPAPDGGKGNGRGHGWLGCMECVRDGRHTGQTGSRQDCPKCKGRGYLVSGSAR